MSWLPAIAELGPRAEFENFSHTITYEETDEETLEIISYSVRIIPQIALPATVTISGPTIAGYFKYAFNDIIEYKSNSRQIKTITTDSDQGAWDKLDTNDIYEMTSFRADTSRNILYNYVAEAYDALTPEILVSSQNYTINLRDLNWTPGLINLKNLVALTQST